MSDLRREIERRMREAHVDLQSLQEAVSVCEAMIRDERERLAAYIEGTFGRMSLLSANGYMEGRDVAERIRCAPQDETEGKK